MGVLRLPRWPLTWELVSSHEQGEARDPPSHFGRIPWTAVHATVTTLQRTWTPPCSKQRPKPPHQPLTQPPSTGQTWRRRTFQPMTSSSPVSEVEQQPPCPHRIRPIRSGDGTRNPRYNRLPSRKCSTFRRRSEKD